ncbi:MAG TPA: hypothetical protein GX395_05125 [Clostridia bacterium]|jgi:SOS response regulatory protein OraA/RecX|nr:hypothetical protein [Clostridia bacterium]
MKKNPLSLALKKLAVRTVSKKEMDAYLAKHGFGPEERQQVLRQLTEWRYLDDQKLAQYWYDYYIKHKPMGYALLSRKLQEKGIPQDCLAGVLADYDEATESRLAESLAEKFLRRKSKSKLIKVKEAAGEGEETEGHIERAEAAEVGAESEENEAEKTRQKTKEALQRHLCRKGFSPAVILRTTEKLFPE